MPLNLTLALPLPMPLQLAPSLPLPMPLPLKIDPVFTNFFPVGKSRLYWYHLQAMENVHLNVPHVLTTMHPQRSAVGALVDVLLRAFESVA